MTTTGDGTSDSTAASSENGTASTIRRGRDLDRLATLEEERRFLLRSLRDLEREREAGDVDDVDYETLKNGYTVRAAAVLREIEHGRRQLAPKKPRRAGRTALVGAACAIAAVGIGFALAGAWGEREPGQNITGETPGGQTDGDEIRRQLAEARAAMSGGDFVSANAIFIEVDRRELERGVDNVEARTYVGWTTALRARIDPNTDASSPTYEIALLALNQAIAMDANYADPHCFAAIIEYNFRENAKAALPYVDRCQELDPPADVEEIVNAFANKIRAAVDDL